MLACAEMVTPVGVTGQSGAARRDAGVADAGHSALGGVVRSRFRGGLRPLPSAIIELVGQGISRAVSADSVGHYTFDDLPEGSVRLRISHSGHETVSLTVLLTGSSNLSLDIELEATPLELPGLDVASRAPAEVSPDDLAEPSLARAPDFALELLELGPGLSETGIAEAVRSLPGNDAADPTDVLFMRGSTTELKLVLLDGVPVATPFHIGGLLRSFEPGVLASAGFYVGGAPARYDGGLTHILDLTTRTARRDRVRASGSMDLLSTSVATEMPLGRRAGLIASARHLHDFGQAPLGGTRPYGYDDVLLSFDGDPAPGHSVRATGFWNEESVRLDYVDGPARAQWGNGATSLRYEGRLGDAGLAISLGASRYDAQLPLRPAPTDDTPDPAEILASTRSDRLRLVAEAMWGDAGAPLRAGVSFENLGADFAAEAPRDGLRSARAGGRSVVGIFADGMRSVAPGVTVRGGLRADVFDKEGPRLSPRLSVAFELGPTALLTVATGRYHQVVQTLTSSDASVTPGFTSGELLPVALADHVVLSLEQRLTPALGLGLDGYWKRFQGVQDGTDDPLFNSGVDVRVKSAGPRVAAWLGYGLSWFWSAAGPSGVSSDFAGRHLLSAGASGALAGPLRAEATLSYGAGLPSTGIPFGSAATEALDNASPGLETLGGTAGSDANSLPAAGSFLRLDLEVHADFHPEWAGHQWRIRPYVRLLNPLHRRDALFYTYQPGSANSTLPLTQRPVLPVFGFSISY